jgi:hypothetical protein
MTHADVFAFRANEKPSAHCERPEDVLQIAVQGTNK